MPITLSKSQVKDLNSSAIHSFLFAFTEGWYDVNEEADGKLTITLVLTGEKRPETGAGLPLKKKAAKKNAKR